MQNEPTKRLETLFHAASSRPQGAERQAYLDGACGDDARMRARVEALLAAHDGAGAFLESPALENKREGPGTSIGPYKLLQEIGEGGMGVVYMAEQEQPVRRKVALKVIKLGMDTKQVIARFEAERQALAMMEHAHIARVLDAGATSSGRPYFVMELVRGVPINEYCDTHKLTTNERLGLFVAVCRAVQHAHQKGIIHRDLKPSNVLVTSHDGTPVPKIIDFGVAKATNQKLTERTLFTEFHQIIGTPEYMSPEQAEMSGLDVDTRSDIYSLGVLLYKLLTGTTPVDPTELRTAAFAEMTRMIREDQPPAPSTRISKLGLEAETIAKRHGSDPRSLSRHLRGELDWIVMKALEKDRTRRYENASAFANDVVRHLEDRPVEAGPPGTWYRLSKFARRNQKAVLATCMLLVVVGLGLAGTVTGFLRARAEAARSTRISDSLQEVLAMTDATRAADKQAVQEVLANVRALFGEEHATYAAVLNTLAIRMHDAGDFDAAIELGQQSLRVWEKVYGSQYPNMAVPYAHLGSFLRAKGDDEAAEEALRTALAIFARNAQTQSPASYEARIQLADLLGNRGAYEEADALLVEALATLRDAPSPVHFRILATLERRVFLHLNQPKGNALEVLREIYEETHQFYPEDSPVLAIAALGYGRQLFEKRQNEQAEGYLREAIQRFTRGDNPPRIHLIAAYDLLFQIIRSREDRASVLETDELLGQMIATARSIWGTEALVSNLNYYATRLFERGRLSDALDALLDAHQVLVDGGRTLFEREDLRDKLTKLACEVALRPALEAPTYARASEAVECALLDEPEHPAMRFVLGASLFRRGEFERALEILEGVPPLSETHSGLARRLAPLDHAFRGMAHAQLGNIEIAREELAALLDHLAHSSTAQQRPAVVDELRALINNTPAPRAAGKNL